MSAVIIKRTWQAVKTHMFNDYTLDISGELSSFIYGVEEFSFYNTTDFLRIHQEHKVVYSGYYKVEEFSKYLANSEVNTVGNLKKNHGYAGKWEYAEVGDTVEIKTMSTDVNSTFFTLETYTVTHNSSNSYVLSGKLNKSILGTPVVTTVPGNAESSGFYTNHVSGITNSYSNMDTPLVQEQKKRRYFKFLVFCALRIQQIVDETFPVLLDGGSTNVNTTVIGVMINSIKNDWINNQVVNNLVTHELKELYEQMSTLYVSVFLNQFAFKNASINARTLMLMRVLSSSSALSIIDVSTKIEALKSILVRSSVDGSHKALDFDILDEAFALKIINSVDLNNQTEVNAFLGGLIDEKFATASTFGGAAYRSLYALLYEQMINHHSDGIVSSYGPDRDYKTRFVFDILFLWTESKYNPYKNIDVMGNPDYTLIDNGTYEYDTNLSKDAVINYVSEKGFWGTYNDRFVFSFSDDGTGIYPITTDGAWTVQEGMNTYQPITLVTYPSETDVSIQIPELNGEYNGAVPIFLLKYIDDHGDLKSLNIKIGLFVDVVTTLTGIGNLAKLRHLRKLSKLGQFILIYDSVQIVTGVLNLFLTHAEFCNNSEFCRKLRRVLTFIEISQLISDPLVFSKIRKSAYEVVEEGTQNGWPIDMLDNTYGPTPKQKLEELAELDVLTLFNKIKADIHANFLARLNKGNLTITGIPHNPPQFVLIHTDTEIASVIDYGFDAGLSKFEIESLLYISCRNNLPNKPIKFILSSELKTQMSNWIIVKGRNYSYKFNSLINYEFFKTKVIDQLDDWYIPSNNVRVQGSSLRTPNARDLDVAIVITEDQIMSVKEGIIKRYKNTYSGPKGVFDTKGRRSYNNAVDDLEKAFKKGKVDSRSFGLLEGQKESFVTELRNLRSTYTESIDISIIVQGRGFDTPPYLKF